MADPFFSIVIPAHNEEGYIGNTLAALAAQDYPKDRYEVIVVENGSSDGTRAEAEAHIPSNGRVLSTPAAGVAAARNLGIDAASMDCDWLVLLDADTRFLPGFLGELALHIAQNREVVVGSCYILPYPSSAVARAWLAFFNALRAVFGVACNVMFVKRSALGEERFDTTLAWMEDVHFVAALKRRGHFFYLQTRSVSTSTRRYESDGWLYHFIANLFVGLLPRALQRKLRYAPVR